MEGERRGEKMFGRMVTGVLRNLDNPTRNPMKNDGRREEEEEEKEEETMEECKSIVRFILSSTWWKMGL